MIVCIPNANDIDAAITLGEEMHAESDFADLPFDRNKILVNVVNAVQLRHGNPIIALVAKDNDEVIGFAYGRVSTFFFNNDRVANDYGIFVKRSKRGAIAAKLLVEAFVNEAKARECKRVYLGSTTGIEPHRTMQLYERLGFDVIGGIARRRL